VYEKALRLLHPLMPFLTEELWHRLELSGKSIALAAYPQFAGSDADAEAERVMTTLQSIIVDARRQRADNRVEQKQTVDAEIFVPGAEYADIQRGEEAIAKLGRLNLTLRSDAYPGFDGRFFLKLRLAVDRARLEKENEALEKQVANLDRQFENQEFMSKAPEKVIASMRQKKAEYLAQIAKNRAALDGA
jgi:valyl-tRNA synthetase